MLRKRKRHKSLVDDLRLFVKGLREQTIKGNEVIHGVFKYRMAIKSKGKGKSGGARIITYEETITGESKTITLLSIYDKSYKSSVTKVELAELQKKAGLL